MKKKDRSLFDEIFHIQKQAIFNGIAAKFKQGIFTARGGRVISFSSFLELSAMIFL